MSEVGPITPLDIIYGHRPSIAGGMHFMAHRCGFTQKTLMAELNGAGFNATQVGGRPAPDYDLWALAFVSPTTQDVAMAYSAAFFPGS